MRRVFGTNRHFMNILLTALFITSIIGFGVSTFARTADEISKSERRKLAQLPALSFSSILSGKYFSDLETFMLDQFPIRDRFLRMKAVNQFYIFSQKDSHNIFIKNGTAIEISYPFPKGADELAARKITMLTDAYFHGMNVYVSIIPDKAYYLAKQNGYPSIDYIRLQENIRAGCKKAVYIDIFGALTADNYYHTDSHWKQECLLPVAEKLLTSMGRCRPASVYTVHELYPFYGVYCGQSALPLPPDKLSYLTSDLLSQAIVYRVAANSNEFEDTHLYFPEMIDKNDPYDLFLGGACSVTILENTQFTGEEKELYLFSDSFGRSIAPHLLEGYSRVYLIDIRYIRASLLSKLVNFKAGGDVLFMYSIQTLDTSSSLNTD
ncbi:MAG: DHHW family protein [Saccharofermentanales bacterium]